MPYPDEFIDLQRMPGQVRPPTHTPERTDPTIHTIDHPFCYDPACSCHSNVAEIQRVQQWLEQGYSQNMKRLNILQAGHYKEGGE